LGGATVKDSTLGGSTGALRGLGRGLVAYGVIGLLVAAIGFGAMVWVNGRISDVRAEARTTVAQLAGTIEVAAIVLRGASTTTDSFSGTVEGTAQAVDAAAGTIAEIRSDLASVESQLRSINIFGATPLAPAADAIARIATSMEGLDTQLPLMADDLEANRAALALNADMLTELGTGTAALADRLGPSTGEDSLDDIQRVMALTLLMFAAWAFVPALAALALGIWLGRAVGGSRPT
jgi:hypothetical protein